MPKGSVIMGPNDFFSGPSYVPAHPSYREISLGEITAIDQGEPRFFHNRHEGNFDEVQ